jgi:hypothetical protein
VDPVPEDVELEVSDDVEVVAVTCAILYPLICMPQAGLAVV